MVFGGRVRFAALLALALLPASLLAQDASTPTVSAVAVSSPAAEAPPALPPVLGKTVPLEGGPWVLGEVLFVSDGKVLSDPALRDKVRGSRGALYTRADVYGDRDGLLALDRFENVAPSLYEIEGAPVPPDFVGVVSSTWQVRLVFTLSEKAAPPPPPDPRAKRKKTIPPAAVSGIVFTPTAWRGAGFYKTPGLGLDVNAAYMIGRLYGKNSFANSPRKTNYIDRVGVWMLTADGKIQMQSEGDIRPAIAVGGQGIFLFRDSGQPKVDDPNPTVTVNASQKTTKLLSDGYLVVSKKFGPARTSVGFMEGSAGNMVAEFSEFLTPDALRFFANKGTTFVRSHSMPFASVLLLPKPEYPLAVEYIKFNGAALNPWMINLKVGYFLKLNFDLAFLKFDGGYDLLGMLQFRYNHFPRK